MNQPKNPRSTWSQAADLLTVSEGMSAFVHEADGRTARQVLAGRLGETVVILYGFSSPYNRDQFSEINLCTRRGIKENFSVSAMPRSIEWTDDGFGDAEAADTFMRTVLGLNPDWERSLAEQEAGLIRQARAFSRKIY